VEQQRGAANPARTWGHEVLVRCSMRGNQQGFSAPGQQPSVVEAGALCEPDRSLVVGASRHEGRGGRVARAL
jgi:hypothetical protein